MYQSVKEGEEECVECMSLRLQQHNDYDADDDDGDDGVGEGGMPSKGRRRRRSIKEKANQDPRERRTSWCPSLKNVFLSHILLLIPSVLLLLVL